MAKTLGIPSPATTAGAAPVEELGDEEPLGLPAPVPLVILILPLPLVGKRGILGVGVMSVVRGVSPCGIDMMSVSVTLENGITGVKEPVVIGKIRISVSLVSIALSWLGEGGNTFTLS